MASNKEVVLLYVVASMEPELAGLKQELEALEPSRPLGVPVEFRVLGVGPGRSRKAMAAAFSGGRRRPTAVLMLGVAGAVEQGMETGQVVMAARYLLDSPEGTAAPIEPCPEMLEVAEAAAADLRMPVSRSSSLTVNHLIAEGWEREQLREKYGAGNVNMEDYAVAASCRDAGVPFLSVRVILDTAEQSLPGFLPGLSRNRNAVFTQVFMRPWRIPTLLRLKSQMQLCQVVLTRFGLSYLEMEAARRKSQREKTASEAIY